MTYEALLSLCDSCGLTAKEKDLQAHDGRIKGRRVAIRRTLQTQKEKACILAEELGHYITTYGDIMCDSPDSHKQERKARIWAYDVQIGLSGLIDAWEARCSDLYEIADYLDVTPAFLSDGIKHYRDKYGQEIQYDGYIIRFEPHLDISKEME